MTLEEAIDNFEQEIVEFEGLKKIRAVTHEDYAKIERVRQLVEWLKELKDYRERMSCDDAISRQAVFESIDDCNSDGLTGIFCSYDAGERFKEYIKKLPPVNPQRTGHWIEVAKYSDGKHKIECSKCGNHIFDRGHANSYNVRKKYKYCPSCGAKIFDPQESEVNNGGNEH